MAARLVRVCWSLLWLGLLLVGLPAVLIGFAGWPLPDRLPRRPTRRHRRPGLVERGDPTATRPGAGRGCAVLAGHRTVPCRYRRGGRRAGRRRGGRRGCGLGGAGRGGPARRRLGQRSP